jgi:D-sedoheptulose 7-phosphate isomerase
MIVTVQVTTRGEDGMIDELEKLCTKYPDLVECREQIAEAFQLIRDSYKNGGKTLTCGNGGSAADSDHIVGELMKGFMLKRPISSEERQVYLSLFPEDGAYLADHLQGALPAISLAGHSALTTAFANDVAADLIFAQQVYGYGKAGDVLIGLSTSGNSKNVVHAMQVAKAKGLHTVALTGEGGGKLKDLCDVVIRVPRTSTPDIQELHLPIYHVLCVMLEREFFAS